MDLNFLQSLMFMKFTSKISNILAITFVLLFTLLNIVAVVTSSNYRLFLHFSSFFCHFSSFVRCNFFKLHSNKCRVFPMVLSVSLNLMFFFNIKQNSFELSSELFTSLLSMLSQEGTEKPRKPRVMISVCIIIGSVLVI